MCVNLIIVYRYAPPVIESYGIATHIEAKQPFEQPKLIAALVKPGCLDHQSSSEQQQKQQSVSPTLEPPLLVVRVSLPVSAAVYL